MVLELLELGDGLLRILSEVRRQVVSQKPNRAFEIAVGFPDVACADDLCSARHTLPHWLAESTSISLIG